MSQQPRRENWRKDRSGKNAAMMEGGEHRIGKSKEKSIITTALAKKPTEASRLIKPLMASLISTPSLASSGVADERILAHLSSCGHGNWCGPFAHENLGHPGLVAGNHELLV